ncbi:auxin-induced protein 15A [Cornus florida]|uniref:auxin-induced protein 15A n=1 Tax=Cornus florida TaxID=4283 RepID=UPI00289FA600|nr:auxin-induced protein 15A [Cornus florida]
MLGKRIGSVKKLAKKVKVKSRVEGEGEGESSHYESLLREREEGSSPSGTTPTGFLAIYVGEERQRFVVPTGYLSHPLFKMLLEKAYNEFGFEQRNGLVVPCNVSTFQEVVSAVECSQGKFDFGNLVEEFI